MFFLKKSSFFIRFISTLFIIFLFILSCKKDGIRRGDMSDDILKKSMENIISSEKNLKKITVAGGRGTPISHISIKMILPGEWAVKTKDNILSAESNSYASVIQMFQQVESNDNSISVYFSNAITNFFQALGFRIGKKYPEEIATGFTKTGIPFAAQSFLLLNKNNQQMFSYCYILGIGTKYQPILVLSNNSEGFGKLAKDLAVSIESVEFINPPENFTNNFSNHNLSNDSFLFCKFRRPSIWKMSSGDSAGQYRYEMTPNFSKSSSANPSEVIVCVNFQPFPPSSPATAIKLFLILNTKSGKETYKIERNWQVVSTYGGRLTNGINYAGILYKCDFKNDDSGSVYYIGGFVFFDNKYSIYIGTDYSIWKLAPHYTTKEVIENNYNTWFDVFKKIIPAIGSSVVFDSTGIVRNENAEKWLVQKKTFRYSKDTSGAGVYIYVKENWKFYSDLTAETEKETFANIQSYFGTSSSGIKYYTNSYFNPGFQDDKLHFQVWEKSSNQYLVILNSVMNCKRIHKYIFL